MWKYSKPSAQRSGNGVHRSMSFFTQGTSGKAFRISVPLLVAAAASVFAWLSGSASKPATTADVTKEEATSGQQIDTPKPAPTQSTSSIDTHVQLDQSQAAQGSAVETKLNVNSEPVAIPENGSVHKVIQNDNGTTTVDVSVGSQNTGSSEKSTSMSVEVNSSSQAESGTADQEGP